MNPELITIKHYQNETEFSMLYTLKDKEGRFSICGTGTVYYGERYSELSGFLLLEVPCYRGQHDLFAYKIDGKFAVYNENHEKITREYDFMDDLIEEIDERDLKLFGFEYDKNNI
jgi:hypothetical protein